MKNKSLFESFCRCVSISTVRTFYIRRNVNGILKEKLTGGLCNSSQGTRWKFLAFSKSKQWGFSSHMHSTASCLINIQNGKGEKGKPDAKYQQFESGTESPVLSLAQAQSEVSV